MTIAHRQVIVYTKLWLYFSPRMVYIIFPVVKEEPTPLVLIGNSFVLVYISYTHKPDCTTVYTYYITYFTAVHTL